MPPDPLSLEELWAQLSVVSGYLPWKVEEYTGFGKGTKNADRAELEDLTAHWGYNTPRRGSVSDAHFFSFGVAGIQPANVPLNFRTCL